MKLHFYGPKNLILNIGFSKENIMDSCYKNKEEILFILLLCENPTEHYCLPNVSSKQTFISLPWVCGCVRAWVGGLVRGFMGHSLSRKHLKIFS